MRVENAGQSITEHGIIGHLKKREAKQFKLTEKEAKKFKTICKPLMPLPNPAENEVTQEEKLIILLEPKRRKVIKLRGRKIKNSNLNTRRLIYLAFK